jgi:hypothetical protein
MVTSIQEKIVNFLVKNKERGLIVYAPYGIGKSTTILLTLHYCYINYHDSSLPLYIYLHNTPSYDDAESIIKEVTLQIITKILHQFPDVSIPDEYEDFTAGLRFLLQKLDKRVVILIDEFDVLQTNPRLNEEEKEKLAKFIYDLQAIPEVIMFVFSIPNAESFFTFKELEERFDEVYFEPLSYNEVNNLLSHYSEIYDFKFTENAAKKIHELTKGFPRLVTKVLRLCWDQIRDKDEMVIDSVLLDGTQEKYWDIDALPVTINYQGKKINITDMKKDILKALLLELDGEGTAQDIAEKFADNITSQRVAANLRQFVDIGVLERKNKMYRIDEDFFKKLTRSA